MYKDVSLVIDPAVKAFLVNFFQNREVNFEYYSRVPEDNYDFRLVNTPSRTSDSVRESLAHQINVERTYMKAIETGELKFGSHYDKTLETKSKDFLLAEMQKTDNELVQLLTTDGNSQKMIKVPWSKELAPAINMFWALDSHEVLHTGWNLALMDVLNIDRFAALRNMWG